MGIGSLNESPLHQALKALYATESSVQEVAIGAYVADVMHADQVIYEIQTSGFGRLRSKLRALLQSHKIVVVHPIVTTRYIHKLTDDADVVIRPRRSPKRGRTADLLEQLVSLPELLDHPNFEVEVVLVEIDEFRRMVRRRRGEGWGVVQRRLRTVVGRERFRTPEDLFRLLVTELAEPFSTAELATAMDASRGIAQKLAFCLRACGRIEPSGKRGNSILYRRAIESRVGATSGRDCF